MQLIGIRMKPGLRVMVSRGIIVCLCCGVLATAGCENKKEAVAPPPPIVEVVTVAVRDVPIYQEWVGALDGNVNAVIKPQVSGYLIKQNYTEGQVVKKGQVLFEIDPRTFQAVLDQTKGSLDQAKGDLARAEAAFVTAKADLARVKPLAAKNAVSQKDLDDATGKELSTRASVEAAKAAIVAATANVESAKLNLDFTKITSPVDGYRRDRQDPARQPGGTDFHPGIDHRFKRQPDQGVSSTSASGNIYRCGTAVRTWRTSPCS